MGSDISRVIDDNTRESDLQTRPAAEREAIVNDLSTFNSVKSKLDSALYNITKDRFKELRGTITRAILDTVSGYSNVATIATGDYTTVLLAVNSKRGGKRVGLKIQVIDDEELEESHHVSLATGLNAPVLDNALAGSRTIVLKAKHTIQTIENRKGWVLFYEVDLPYVPLSEQAEKRRALGIPLNIAEIRKIFRDVAPQLLELHLNQTAQLDLGPDQIVLLEDVDRYVFLASNPHPVVDSLSPFSGRTEVTTSKQPNQYSSPEFTSRQTTFNPYKSDVFSLGLLLLDLSTPQKSGSNPLKNVNTNKEELRKVVKDARLDLEGYSLSSNKLSSGFNFVQATLEEDESKRIDLIQLCIYFDCLPLKLPVPIIANKVKTGNGLYTVKYIDGSTYEGPLDGDRRDGQRGTLYDEGKNVYYRGDWTQDMINGVGMLCLNKFITIEGTFARGRINGKYEIRYKKPVEVTGTLSHNRLPGQPVEFEKLAAGYYNLIDIDANAGLSSLIRVRDSKDLEVFVNCGEKTVSQLLNGKIVSIEKIVEQGYDGIITIHLQVIKPSEQLPKTVLIHFNEGNSNISKLFAGVISPINAGVVGRYQISTNLNLLHAGKHSEQLLESIVQTRPLATLKEIHISDPGRVNLAHLFEPEISRDLTKIHFTNISEGKGIPAIHAIANAAHITKLEEIHLQFRDQVQGKEIAEVIRRLVSGPSTFKKISLKGAHVNNDVLLALTQSVRFTDLLIGDSVEPLENGFHHVANNPNANSIQGLTITNCKDIGKSLDHIALGTSLSSLNSLELSGLSEEAMKHENFVTLFEHKKLAQLRHLRLGTFNERTRTANPVAITQAHVDTVANSTNIGQLESLSLVTVTPVDATKLIKKQPRLKSLTLSLNGIQASEFGTITHLNQLDTLVIVGGAQAKNFPTAIDFRSLKKLHIYVDPKDEPFLQALSKSRFPALESLHIFGLNDADNARDLLTNAPVLRSVELRGKKAIKDDALKSIAGALERKTLKELKLSSTDLTAPALTEFLKTAPITTLDVLQLETPNLSDEGLLIGRTRVKDLRFPGSSLSTSAKRTHGHHAALTPLQSDEYTHQGIRPEIVGKILRSKYAKELTTISIVNAELESAVVLARIITRLAGTNVNALKLKDIRFTKPDPQGYDLFKDLAASKKLKNVHEISISNFPYEHNLFALFENAGLESVTRLELDSTNVRLQGPSLDSFFRIPVFAKLQSLVVANCKNIDFRPVISNLSLFSWAPNLVTFSLKGQNLHDTDFQRVFSQSFPLLEELDLSGNNLSENTLINLMSRGTLPALKILVLRNVPGISDEAKRRYRAYNHIVVL